MHPRLNQTSWGRNLLLGAGLLALLVLLTPGWARGQNLVVDGGATKIVPPSITFDNETIGETGQGTLKQFSGSNTFKLQLTLGDQSTGRGTYKLFSGTLGGEGEIIGNDGTGSFKQFGGSNTVNSELILGNQPTVTKPTARALTIYSVAAYRPPSPTSVMKALVASPTLAAPSHQAAWGLGENPQAAAPTP